jgi:hypothetical protein
MFLTHKTVVTPEKMIHAKVEVQWPIFLTSALAGGEWSVESLDCSNTRERDPGKYSIVPRADLELVENMVSVPPGNRTMISRLSSLVSILIEKTYFVNDRHKNLDPPLSGRSL